MKGSYCLILKLERDEIIPIGKRENNFPGGYYVYVGSALNNLEKRIQRHRSSDKKKFWHIDYFLEHAEIIGEKIIESSGRMECILSNRVKLLSDSEPMNGFGSSDCNCNTHLYYFETNPLQNRAFMNLFVQG